MTLNLEKPVVHMCLKFVYYEHINSKLWTYHRKALFASFEGRGRKGLRGEGKEGKGERRESLPLVWELKKPTRKGDGGFM